MNKYLKSLSTGTSLNESSDLDYLDNSEMPIIEVDINKKVTKTQKEKIQEIDEPVRYDEITAKSVKVKIYRLYKNRE